MPRYLGAAVLLLLLVGMTSGRSGTPAEGEEAAPLCIRCRHQPATAGQLCRPCQVVEYHLREYLDSEGGRRFARQVLARATHDAAARHNSAARPAGPVSVE